MAHQHTRAASSLPGTDPVPCTRVPAHLHRDEYEQTSTPILPHNRLPAPVTYPQQQQPHQVHYHPTMNFCSFCGKSDHHTRACPHYYPQHRRIVAPGVPTQVYQPYQEWEEIPQQLCHHPAPTARKAVPYPEYKTGKCPETHCRKFGAALLLNGENQTLDQLELFANSLTDKESNWFAYHRKLHPATTLHEVFTAFKRRYRTIKTDDQTYIQFRTLIQLPNESVDDYAERLQQLAEHLTVPPDDMFMLSNFRAGLLEYLQVATVGLNRPTFLEAVNAARTAEEGLPRPARYDHPALSTEDNPRRKMKCSGCGRTGHDWETCFRNPASKYGKRTDAATVLPIQPQPPPNQVSNNNRGHFFPNTPIQRYPCNICGSMEHPGHKCPLLLDDDVKKAIQKKLPQPTVSSVDITAVHTIDTSHIQPRTTGDNDQHSHQRHPEEMSNNHTTIDLCDNILQQIDSQTIQVSLKNLMSIAPVISEHVQRHLYQKGKLPLPVLEDTPIDVHSVVAIDRHIPIISVKIRNQEIHEVLLDGGSGVNVITEAERCRLGLPEPTPAHFKLRMADSSLVQPTGLLHDVTISIHGISYTIILTVISCKDVNSAYTLLLGRPWLRAARVIHNWANDHIQIMGNGKMHTIHINRQVGFEATSQAALVCYNHVEDITKGGESILGKAEEFVHPSTTVSELPNHQVRTSTRYKLPDIVP